MKKILIGYQPNDRLDTTNPPNNNENGVIEYKGYKYWYERKPARNRIDICIETKDPNKYCNGIYLYSDKDPGTGVEFVVVKTTNPRLNLPGRQTATDL